MRKRVKLRVYGRVQGVFYRQSTLEQARVLGLEGWVANEFDGSVSIDAQGDKDKLESFIIWCKKGPARAEVAGIDIEWHEELDESHSGFKISR